MLATETVENARMRARARSAARSHAWCWAKAMGAWLLARASGTERENLEAALAACQQTRSPWTRRFFAPQLQPYFQGRKRGFAHAHQVGWSHYDRTLGQLANGSELPDTLVLKAPAAGGEKGVLLCASEVNWMRLFAHRNVRKVLDTYLVVGTTSCSPPDCVPIASYAGLATDPLFVCVANRQDITHLDGMHAVARPVALSAGDFLHGDDYTPRPHNERSIDLLVVADWTQQSRHWLLFEALHSLPRNLRVVLVGEDATQRSENVILEEARAFGVRQDLEIHTGLSRQRIASMQCDARVAATFGHRPNDAVRVVEALFAGAPVAVMADAGPSVTRYINARTGVLLRRRKLARQLQHFIDASGRFTPRQWALHAISADRASQRLNAILRAYSRAQGRSEERV